MSESIESLLEFLRISSRVSVVQLEPPRARAFAEVLERHLADRSPSLDDAIADRDDARADAKRWQTAFEAQNHARSFDLHRERDEARAERDLAQRAAVHWEGVAAANALDVVTEVAAEREACAVAATAAIRHSQQTTDQCRTEVAYAIRSRGRS